MFKILLVLIILEHIFGIIFIKIILNKEKSETYDITGNFIFMVFCIILYIVLLRFNYVTFDKNNNILIIKKLGNKELVHINNIIKIERFYIFACKIIYKKDKEIATKVFQPSLRRFFPLKDFPHKIDELLKNTHTKT